LDPHTPRDVQAASSGQPVGTGRRMVPGDEASVERKRRAWLSTDAPPDRASAGRRVVGELCVRGLDARAVGLQVDRAALAVRRVPAEGVVGQGEDSCVLIDRPARPWTVACERHGRRVATEAGVLYVDGATCADRPAAPGLVVDEP